MEEQVWTTREIIQAIIGTGIVSAIASIVLSGAKDAIASYLRQRRLAAYTAMRLAVALERFAQACASVIDSNKNAYQRPGEEFPDWDIHFPPLAEFPQDPEGWRALAPDLAERSLALRNRISQSEAIISSTAEYAEHELDDEVARQLGGRGLEAWHISRDLRWEYELRQADLVYEFTSTLKSASEGTSRP